jgi:hypothetical protein
MSAFRVCPSFSHVFTLNPFPKHKARGSDNLQNREPVGVEGRRNRAITVVSQPYLMQAKDLAQWYTTFELFKINRTVAST